MGVLSNHPFVKMNGLGNEIVVVDMRPNPNPITATDARSAAAGVRYDQLMAIYPARTTDADALVCIFNNDGSEAGACGNGMRCVADILFKESRKTSLVLEIRTGLLKCWQGATPLTCTVDMGVPRFGWDEIPLAKAFSDTRRIDLAVGPSDRPTLHSPSVANMGNPHAIFWVDDIDAYDLGEIGPLLESHPVFPDRANISLARVVTREHLMVRTWERGAGLTRACGSAACAALVCASRTGRAERKAIVKLPGGDLAVEWRSDDRVLMTGPVEYEFEGRFDPALFASAEPAR
ncbi:MAG TPA: diaminopimelate epimerase [Xanthobacteraceae bacterium]|jgi:diaminopimelate epimerase|nr:diaminopimelate epimerase [Xanthobacteraceae bacterium]